MHAIAKKVAITAAPDGLILQPLAAKGQRHAPAVRIGYDNAAISPVLSSSGDKVEKGFECFGIVGLLKVLTHSYVIAITRREQIAQLYSKPVYCVTGVAIIPLSSHSSALSAVNSTRNSLAKPTSAGNNGEEAIETDDEESYSAMGSDDVEDDEVVSINPELEQKKLHRRTTSVVADVFEKKNTNGYARFAQNWFKRTPSGGLTGGVGLSAAAAATEDDGVSIAESIAVPAPVVDGDDASKRSVATDEDKDGHVAELLPKLLRTTSLLFGSSKSFFFSYDHDITRAVGAARENGADELPLHQAVDPLFFWNKHVVQPFIDAGQYSLVLPLMQGFVGQQSFVVERNPVVIPKDVPKHDAGVQLKDFTKTAQTSEEERKEETAEPISIKRSDTPRYDEEAFDAAPVGSPILNSHVKEHTSSSTVENAQTYLLTLISRRSVHRAGLRYLRRGVDDDGHVANSVETEQILSSPSFTGKIYSFVQIRGSIPVFFSQSPYSFKPVPQMMNSEARNYEAFKRHFANLKARYGKIMADNLVETHDNEAIVGSAYEKYVKQLNEEGGIDSDEIAFEWFDFHAQCRGMKFENVSLLVDTLASRLDDFGFTVSENGKITQKQTGVLRTNCMDCLDRTNVTQSAVAWRTIESQLRAEGFDWSSQLNQETKWFNVLWADNGDAISRQYASTAALKGDFTRTKKRDYRGVIADAGLSITRFYSGIVNDYFSQTSIDFLLGNVDSQVFDEFATNLMSADPAVSVSRTRQRGIEISYKLAVADQSEELVGGWAFLTPKEPNTVRASAAEMEEAVLLLTDVALYLCRLDWGMEKVRGFERVDLRHVKSLKWGTYITDTLTKKQTDERTNVGLVIRYIKGNEDIMRVNTRSLDTLAALEEVDAGTESDTSKTSKKSTTPAKPPTRSKTNKPKSTPEERVIALKSLPSKTSSARSATEGQRSMTESQQAESVAEAIGRVVAEVRGEFGKGDGEGKEKGGLEEGDEELVQNGSIITSREAQNVTSLLDMIGWRVKKLVWA